MRRLTLLAAAATAAACAGRATVSTTPTTRPRVGSAEPTTLRYATGTARYRVEGLTHTEQEMMGNTAAFDLNTTMLVSTVASEEAANLSLAITMDSIAVSGTAPNLDPQSFAAARAHTFHALFTPAGRPVSVGSPDSNQPVMVRFQGRVIQVSPNAVFEQLARGFRYFLPALPPGSISAGASWSDTVSQAVPIPGGDGTTTVHSQRQHRILGWETRDSVRALHIATTTAITMSGSGSVQGQPIELNGTGTSTMDQFVSAAGVYLGATQTDSTNITVNVLSVGITVPVRQAQRTTVTRLP